MTKRGKDIQNEIYNQQNDWDHYSEQELIYAHNYRVSKCRSPFELIIGVIGQIGSHLGAPVARPSRKPIRYESQEFLNNIDDEGWEKLINSDNN